MMNSKVSSILPFLSLLTIGRSQSGRFDILTIGNDILRITSEQERVSQRIDDLWRVTLDSHPFYPSGIFEPFHMVQLLGIPPSTNVECLTEFSRKHMKDGGASCSVNIMNNARVIEDFYNAVNNINHHMQTINSMYSKIFRNLSETVDSRRFELADGLYKTIKDSCQDPSTCLFHQVAGIHYQKINPGHRMSTPLSVRGEVFYTYLLICFHLLKGYAADIYSDGSHPNRTDLIKVGQSKFLIHSNTMATIAFSAIQNAARDIVLGELSGSSLSAHPYIELKWYIGQIIVNEANLNPTGSCWGGCNDYKNATFHKYGSVPSEGTDICSGRILQCYKQTLGFIYPADSDSRRYGGIKGHESSFFGADKDIIYGDIRNYDAPNAKHTDTVYRVDSNWYSHCSVCTCLCDDIENPKTIRTFSLRAVTSDVENSKAITGLRLQEINGTIYIQICEGKLTDIDVASDPAWTPIDTFNKNAFPNDAYTLVYGNQNTVNLDTISLQDEAVQIHLVENHPNLFFFPNTAYVLTGVKFVNRNGSLSFAIRLSAWNSRLKRISTKNQDTWIINRNVKNREKISLISPDVPTKTTDNREFFGKDYSVQFQPTDNVKDFGQTTVPFLDTRDVVTSPPMPLTGAGLFYKGKAGYGGVIGLKLVSIDFSHLIKSELD